MPTKSDPFSAPPARPDPEKHFLLAQLLPNMTPRVAVWGSDHAALARLSNRCVFGAVLDAMISAERIHGRGYLKKADLPKLTELLGLMPAANSGRSRKAVGSSNQEAVVAA